MSESVSVLEKPFERMREGGMSDVVQKCGGHDRLRFLLFQIESVAHQARDMICAQRMLQSCMMSPGKNEMCQSELLDVVQSLKFRGFDKIEKYSFYRYRSVNRIVYDLLVFHESVHEFSHTIHCRLQFNKENIKLIEIAGLCPANRLGIIVCQSRMQARHQVYPWPAQAMTWASSGLGASL